MKQIQKELPLIMLGLNLNPPKSEIQELKKRIIEQYNDIKNLCIK